MNDESHHNRRPRVDARPGGQRVSVEPGQPDLRPSLPPAIGGMDVGAAPTTADRPNGSSPAGAPLNGSSPPAVPANGSWDDGNGVAPEADGAPAAEAAFQGRPAGGCTQAQLRRFIKSRPYVPVHEIRRRFSLNGADDDVNALELDANRLFVGLPPREAQMLGELVRQGDVGYELLLDPVCPVVVGVFPMRPVPRS